MQAEAGGALTAPYISRGLAHSAVIATVVTSVALVVLGMVLSPAVWRLPDLRTQAILLVGGGLGHPKVRREHPVRVPVFKGIWRVRAGLVISVGTAHVGCSTLLFRIHHERCFQWHRLQFLLQT